MKKPREFCPQYSLDSFIKVLSNVLSTAAASMLCAIPTFAQDTSNFTVKRDLNPAGTVRVNKLAEIEAILNIVANVGEILLIVLGIWILIRAFGWLFRINTPATTSSSEEDGLNLKLFLWGVALIVLGLALPGIINWFCGSARDMSYFS